MQTANLCHSLTKALGSLIRDFGYTLKCFQTADDLLRALTGVTLRPNNEPSLDLTESLTASKSSSPPSSTNLPSSVSPASSIRPFLLMTGVFKSILLFTELIAAPLLRCLPEDEMNGFFVAVFRRTSTTKHAGTKSNLNKKRKINEQEEIAWADLT